MNQPKLLLASIFLICNISVKAQEIAELPFLYDSHSSQVLEDNFDTLHNFSESIYANNKLNSIVGSNPENNLFSNEYWPLGTWGNGFFSEAVHNREYPIPNWGENNKLYNIWYDTVHYKGKSFFLSAHPTVWHTSRRVIAYIHAYKNNPLEIYKDRIKEGLTFLIDEQIDLTGGYYDYHKRENQTSTNEILNEEVIHTISAARALSEGFAFLNSIQDYSMNDELWRTIDAVGLNLVLNQSLFDGNIVGQPINGRSWYVWALVGVYKATGNPTYLTLAENITKNFIGYQQNDGYWITPNITDEWHDSYIQYHGIVLRGLAELYTLTNDELLKTDLRTAIVNSINHIINYNGEYGGTYTRLISNGFIYKYHKDDTSKNSTQPYTASSFQLALVYIKQSMVFSFEDSQKIDQLINGTLTALFSEIHKHKVPGVNMMSLALTLNDDFSHQNLTWAASIHTDDTSFDTMTPIDFDNNSIDEIALYDFDGKLYKVYAINNDNPIFSQNTNNGPFFTLMTSGDFDDDNKDEIALYRSTYSDGIVSVLNEDLSWRGSIKTYNVNFDIISPIDYDNNGFQDVVLYDRESNLLNIYKNKINAPVFSGTTLNGSMFDLMTTGDFDGDGEDEIALYRTTDPDGLISFINQDLSWVASSKSKNTSFDMIATIDYDLDGVSDVVLYDRESKLLSIYKAGIDQPVFSRYTTNGAEFDLMISGNFDNDPKLEIAFYRKSDGLVTILDIELNYAESISGRRIFTNVKSNATAIDFISDEINFTIVEDNSGIALIQYELANDTYVEIVLYDLHGNKINSIVKGNKKSGFYEHFLDTRKLPSGIYIYGIVTNNSRQSIKVFHTNY